MKQGVNAFIFFSVGLATGYTLARKMLKDKYERLVQEEVDSVKAALRGYTQEKDEPALDNDEDVSRRDRINYRQYGESLKYIQKQEEKQPDLEPRVISPDEFGEMDEYDQISLTYYADKTLADDSDHPMSDDDIEETIGKESLSHFGEYEQDSVFVRNDRLKADYEILLDQRTYTQILEEKPYLLR